MTKAATLARAKNELHDLKDQIQERRRALAEHGLFDDHFQREWDKVVASYRSARRTVGQGDHQAEATVEAELAAMRDLARRWASRVDGRMSAEQNYGAE